MKYYLLLLLISLSIVKVDANVITNPEFPTQKESLVLYFNLADYSGFGNYTGDVYAHTGVNVEGIGDWENVIGEWGDNESQPKLRYTGSQSYRLEITTSVDDFYNIEEGQIVNNINIVLRSADGTLQSSDLVAVIYKEGLSMSVNSPSDVNIISIGESLDIDVSTNMESDITAKLDGEIVASATGEQLISSVDFTTSGNYDLSFEAVSGEFTAFDTVNVIVVKETEIEALPTGVQKGINYIDDNTVTLRLWAPEKNDIFVIGDFNNWEVSNDYLMNKDGDDFWLTIGNLEAGKEYAFQYLLEDGVKIADPYTEKILDPWNDSYIDNDTYPNLKAYPSEYTTELASVFQTAQVEYQWEIDNYEIENDDELVIYELLIRDFDKDHTYQSVIDRLDYIEDLEVSAIHFMPISEFEGNSSWGYNPSFYFAPDKYYGPKNDLKKLIDECHKRDIAVIFDLVLNHSFGQSPLVRMYWDELGNQPAANNPWYNEESNFKNTSLTWGYDFNHESDATKELIDSINSFWMSEYKVDGFRFDFTKGFSNTPYSASSWGSEYDAARVKNLKRMADEMWKRKEDALVIFEHLADNSEEKELANYGIHLWGNMNHNFGEAAMGFNDSNKSDLSWSVYTNRGWDHANVISYAESHDEERIAYKCSQYGSNVGNYDITDVDTYCDRLELAAAFLIPTPGSKLIWQFGERGYNISIDEGGRTGEKEPYWEYIEDQSRVDLFHTYAKLNFLKKTYAQFDGDASYSGDLTSAIKHYTLSKENDHVVVVGNFGTTSSNETFTLPQSGKWYNYFEESEITIENNTLSVTLAAGEYLLLSTQKYDQPDVHVDDPELSIPTSSLKVYPNPAKSFIRVETDGDDVVEIVNISGQKVYSEPITNNTQINISTFPRGTYIVRMVMSQEYQLVVKQ